MKDTEKTLILLIAIVVMNFIFFPLSPFIFVVGMVYITWDIYKKQDHLMDEKIMVKKQLWELSKQVRRLSSELGMDWETEQDVHKVKPNYMERRVPTRHQLANDQ